MSSGGGFCKYSICKVEEETFGVDHMIASSQENYILSLGNPWTQRVFHLEFVCFSQKDAEHEHSHSLKSIVSTTTHQDCF